MTTDMTTELLKSDPLDDIKNKLLCYLLKDVEDNFEHLTATERSIVGDQETFDELLKHIRGEQ
jgi:hypothetical protein